MEFSPQQDEALRRVAAWLRDRSSDQIFYLAGYAGTGKTTLAKHLADQENGVTQFCAFTGKAALVLRRKGCDNAKTIHSLIYDSKQKSSLKLSKYEEQLAQLILAQGENAPRDEIVDLKIANLRKLIAVEREQVMSPSFQLKEDSAIHGVDLIVADECSMIDEKMAKHLMSFDKKILVLGDPAQLPPVKNAGYFTEREPDFLLTDVRRQALENPILALATKVRNGESIDVGTYGDSRVITKAGSVMEDWLGSEQLLVGKNDTRRALNMRARKARGLTDPLPVKGDRLICLQNDHDVGLLNGSLWDCRECVALSDDRVALSVDSLDNLPAFTGEAHAGPFFNRVVDWREARNAQMFDHAVAITVHKAQGSQWDTVTLVDEWFTRDRAKWLYTGITRAAERITIIRE